MSRPSDYVITVFSAVLMALLLPPAFGDVPSPNAGLSKDEQSVVEELRTAYPAYETKFSQALSNIQCVGKLSLQSYDADVKLRLKEGQGQIELTYTKLASELAKYPKTHVRTRTNSFSYDLAQAVAAMQPERVKQMPDDRNKVDRWRKIERWIAATVYVGNQRLGDLLRSPSFRPTHAADLIGTDGQRRITVLLNIRIGIHNRRVARESEPHRESLPYFLVSIGQL